MTKGQRSHILGTLVATEQTCAQIARAARDGQSPAETGRALTPLPRTTWKEMERALDRVVGQARVLAERFAGDAVRERETREPVSATLYWISFLLRRLEEEVIADISPPRMEAQFGPLPEDARTTLGEAIRDMQSDLAAVRAQVEALRGEKGGG